jgi:hypothetical protein
MKQVLSIHDIQLLMSVKMTAMGDRAKLYEATFDGNVLSYLTPAVFDTLAHAGLIMVTSKGTPVVTERGDAYLGFLFKVPLPIAVTTWELPDDPC